MFLHQRFVKAGRTNAASRGRLCTPRKPRIALQRSATMASSSGQGKENKFVHLPLSTSGAQETTLTARFRLSLSLLSQEAKPLILHREMHSCGHRISTKVPPSPRRSVIHSSYTASFRRTSRPSTSRSSVHMLNTALGQMIWLRTHS
jgi:hypothetical protein